MVSSEPPASSSVLAVCAVTMSTAQMRRTRLFPPNVNELSDQQFNSIFDNLPHEGPPRPRTPSDHPNTPDRSRPNSPSALSDRGSVASSHRASSMTSYLSTSLGNQYPANPAEAAARAARKQARADKKIDRMHNNFRHADYHAERNGSLDHYESTQHAPPALELLTSDSLTTARLTPAPHHPTHSTAPSCIPSHLFRCHLVCDRTVLKTLMAMEMKCSPSEADALIKSCDKTGEGKIDYDSLITQMKYASVGS